VFVFREITFQTFFCLFTIRKVGQRKIFSCQRKIWFDFQENVFFFILGGKYFSEVVKNLKISYYLLIMSNLVLKLLIAIYFVWFFQIHPLKFDFYINFGPYFYDCYLFFSYHFLNWNFFIYQMWSSFFWLLLILFK